MYLAISGMRVLFKIRWAQSSGRSSSSSNRKIRESAQGAHRDIVYSPRLNSSNGREHIVEDVPSGTNLAEAGSQLFDFQKSFV